MRDTIRKAVKLIAGIAILALAVNVSAQVTGFRPTSALNGSTAIFYNGTGDTAVTWAIDDAYATNRTYVNRQGTTITPAATNSVTGEVYPSFSSPVPLYPDRNGQAITNVAISATVTANSSFTNTVALHFSRSANNGTDYDTSSASAMFSFVITPSSTNATTLTTNIPAAYLSGTSHLRLQKVVGGANPTDGGIITVNRVSIGQFVD